MDEEISKRIKILVVDDHVMFRLGVKGAAKLTGDITVVAEAADALSGLAAFRNHSPDVVLMDLRMPNGGGIAAIESIVGDDPEARIVVLSSYDGHEDIHRAVQAGASSYLSKEASNEELMEVVRRVYHGERFLPDKIAARLGVRKVNEPTARERETLALVAKGYSNGEVAMELGIAESTVKVHLRSLFKKLGFADRTQATLYAVREGIVTLD